MKSSTPLTLLSLLFCSTHIHALQIDDDCTSCESYAPESVSELTVALVEPCDRCVTTLPYFIRPATPFFLQIASNLAICDEAIVRTVVNDGLALEVDIDTSPCDPNASASSVLGPFSIAPQAEVELIELIISINGEPRLSGLSSTGPNQNLHVWPSDGLFWNSASPGHALSLVSQFPDVFAVLMTDTGSERHYAVAQGEVGSDIAELELDQPINSSTDRLYLTATSEQSLIATTRTIESPGMVGQWSRFHPFSQLSVTSNAQRSHVPELAGVWDFVWEDFVFSDVQMIAVATSETYHYRGLSRQGDLLDIECQESTAQTSCNFSINGDLAETFPITGIDRNLIREAFISRFHGVRLSR